MKGKEKKFKPLENIPCQRCDTDIGEDDDYFRGCNKRHEYEYFCSAECVAEWYAEEICGNEEDYKEDLKELNEQNRRVHDRIQEGKRLMVK
jgi:hypothetical protein